MSGLGMVMNTAKLAIGAAQYGMNVTGHNIANVNTDGFSRQVMQTTAAMAVPLGGHLLGAGVETQDVYRIVNDLLENKLTQVRSELAANEEADTYMQVLENYFSVNSEDSLNNLISEFWNTWQDLSNNPTGAADRGAVYEVGDRLAQRFAGLNEDMNTMSAELTSEIEAAIDDVNSITSEIADLNIQIVSLETGQSANDLRDQRQTLLTELGKIIDVSYFEQPNNTLSVQTAGGVGLVHSGTSYGLELKDDAIVWEGPSNLQVDITDDISKGSIAGWLNVRDEILPKFRSDLDMLAQELIWSVNYQHSQGVGLQFFDEEITGTYGTDASGLLSTLSFGDKIDYDQDFTMWIKDSSTATPEMQKVVMDMGLSTAAVTKWADANPLGDSGKYEFTVIAGGDIGSDSNVTVTDGSGMGTVMTGADVAGALDNAIVDNQTIYVYGLEAFDPQSILVGDASTADAGRSAASIAQGLNTLEGVSAYASQTSVELDISSLLAGVGDVHANDEVSFTLATGDNTDTISFTVADTDAGTRANFLAAINGAVDPNHDMTLDDSRLSTDDMVTLTSLGGENIGIENLAITDNSTITIDNFVQDSGGVGEMFLDIGGITVNFDLDVSSQQVAAQSLINGLENYKQALSAAGISYELDAAGTGVVLTRTGGGALDITNVDSEGGGDDGGFDVTGAVGTSVNGIDNNTVSLAENGTTGTTVVPTAGAADTIRFGTATVTETGGGGDNAALKTGTVSVILDAGLTIYSTASGQSTAGTFGGDYLANGFTPGDTAAFDLMVAGNVIASVNLAPIGGTNAAIADAISTAFTGGPVMADGASVVLDDPYGNQVTITRDGNDFDFEVANGLSLTFANFTDTDGNAELSLSTDTGTMFSSGGSGNLQFTAGLPGAGTSNGFDSGGGIFRIGADNETATGRSIMTMGGEGGFTGFDAGDTISFFIDDTLVSYAVGANDDTDLELAVGLEAALNNSTLDPSVYSIIRHGASVSILKNDDAPMELTSFMDDNGSGTSNLALLDIPNNTVLDASNFRQNSATSWQIGSEAVVAWEKFDEKGDSKGVGGILTLDNEGWVQLKENNDASISFYIESGSLVAGNTFTLNTDTSGEPDALDYTVSGKANSVLDTYKFRVDSGGKIGTDDIELTWFNGVTYGTTTIEGHDPPYDQVKLELEGMTFLFNDGTLFDGDVFTLNTDNLGYPTQEMPTDWHWTIDSFKDQFNRQAVGVEASVTDNHALRFTPTTSQHKIANQQCSGSDGFCEANAQIQVVNYDALTRLGNGFKLERDDVAHAATGDWAVSPGYDLGYDVELRPIDGLDMDRGFHVDLDGVRAFTVTFDKPVTDNGDLTFDVTLADGLYSFAFGDDEAEDSGVMAALGINTFFGGDDAMTMEINDVVANKDYIAAAQIKAESGEIGNGDNRNALAVSNVQYASAFIAQWAYTRGEDASSSVGITSTLEDYYSSIIGSLGIVALSVSRAKDFSETMESKISEQRDNVSAVSLDEEMINMIKYQHAFSAASKLVTVTDEMLNTLISMR